MQKRLSVQFSDSGTNILFLMFAGLLAAPLIALDSGRSMGEFSYQTWGTGSGLPQNTVHSILQSRDGFLWLATEGGLVRFDGYSFAVLDSSNTAVLKSNHIRSLQEDRQGAMWIATSEGLLRRSDENLESVSTVGNSPENNYLTLHRDVAGKIWAVTPGSLTLCDKTGQSAAACKATHVLAEASSRFTGAMTSADNGTIWLGTQTGLSSLRNGGAGEAVDYPDLPKVPVRAILLDHLSRLWVGTDAGLFVSQEKRVAAFTPAINFPKISVSALFEDRQHTIWVGTDHGLLRLGAASPEAVISGSALTETSVIALTEDTEGDLWVGTEAQGATVLRNQKFVTYTTREGLSDNAVRCVFSDRKGVISIGTSSGVTQLVDGQFRHLTTSAGLSSNVILSLGEDHEGTLLIGTPDGLNRVKGGAVSVTTSGDGLADDFVRSIYCDQDGSLWIGTRRGLTHLEGSSKFITYTQVDGLGSDLVGAIVRSQRGGLWVATLGGLSLLEGKTFKNYRTQDGLSSNVITALHEDAEGDLWIGTGDRGLNVWRAGKFTHFTDQLDLPRAVYGLTEDANGNLWIASNSGIVRVSRRELTGIASGRSDSATVVWYGTSDGLRINECSLGGHPEVSKGLDGTLWFSTVRGAAALYPSAGRLNRVAPPVVIESITVDEQTSSPSELKVVRPGHSRFSFTYAGLSFAAPQKVQYRYKLEGFDKHWIEAGLQRTAYYTNIPPGLYAFRVLARNEDGFWNEQGATMSFRLQPRFYQTIWFYVLMLLSLAGAAFVVYRWRVAEVEARFGAVLQERNRIAREIHDTLAQGFVGISMQLEIVSRLSSSSADVARQHLDQARQIVRDSLSEARRSIWQLRSQTTDNEDLALRLSKAAKQSVGIRPVKLSLEVRGTYRPLSEDLENELLRIGQEAVSNAVRHADPKHIQLELAFDIKKVRLSIQDDGCGFTVGPQSGGPAGHFGLKGMQERADQISAKLVVESEAGKGTKILVEAPLS